MAEAVCAFHYINARSRATKSHCEPSCDLQPHTQPPRANMESMATARSRSVRCLAFLMCLLGTLGARCSTAASAIAEFCVRSASTQCVCVSSFLQSDFGKNSRHSERNARRKGQKFDAKLLSFCPVQCAVCSSSVWCAGLCAMRTGNQTGQPASP